MAPIARLLIFIVLPDGEVIGDSEKYEVENCLPNKVSTFYHKMSKYKTVNTGWQSKNKYNGGGRLAWKLVSLGVLVLPV